MKSEELVAIAAGISVGLAVLAILTLWERRRAAAFRAAAATIGGSSLDPGDPALARVARRVFDWSSPSTFRARAAVGLEIGGRHYPCQFADLTKHRSKMRGAVLLELPWKDLPQLEVQRHVERSPVRDFLFGKDFDGVIIPTDGLDPGWEIKCASLRVGQDLIQPSIVSHINALLKSYAIWDFRIHHDQLLVVFTDPLRPDQLPAIGAWMLELHRRWAVVPPRESPREPGGEIG